MSYHFSLNARVELGSHSVVDRRGQRFHLYFSSLALDGGTILEFTISKPVDKGCEVPPLAVRTHAQVLGDANMIGSTVFVNNASVIAADASDISAQRLPAVVFAGIATWSTYGVFHVLIDAGGLWPGRVLARCLLDFTSPHVVTEQTVPDGARVTVSGLMTGMRGDDPYIYVHDVRTDGTQPCPGHVVQNVPAVAANGGRSFCQWFAHQDCVAASGDESSVQRHMHSAADAGDAPCAAGTELSAPHGAEHSLAADSVLNNLDGLGFYMPRSAFTGPISASTTETVQSTVPSAVSNVSWDGQPMIRVNATQGPLASQTFAAPAPAGWLRSTPAHQQHAASPARDTPSASMAPSAASARAPAAPRCDTPSESDSESVLAWLRYTPEHQQHAASPARDTPSASMAPSAASARAPAAPRCDTPSESDSESVLAWLRSTPEHQQHAASPARDTPSASMAPSSAIAHARCAYRGSPSDIGSAFGTLYPSFQRQPPAPSCLDPAAPRCDTPSESDSESVLAWLRSTPEHQQHAASPARDTPSASMAPSSAIARARWAYCGSPSDLGSALGTLTPSFQSAPIFVAGTRSPCGSPTLNTGDWKGKSTSGTSQSASLQHRLPPSPGPHARSYWKWYDMRVSSATF